MRCGVLSNPRMQLTVYQAFQRSRAGFTELGGIIAESAGPACT
jgi:hypothetical protein